MTASTLPYVTPFPVPRQRRRHRRPSDIHAKLDRLFDAGNAWLDRWENVLFWPVVIISSSLPVIVIEGLNYLAGSPCKGSLSWMLIRVSLQCAVHNPLAGVVLLIVVGSLGAYFVPLLVEGFKAAFGARQPLSADEFQEVHGLEETVPAWA